MKEKNPKLPSFDEAVRHRDFLIIVLIAIVMVGVFIALTLKLLDQEEKHMRDVEQVKVIPFVRAQKSEVNEADLSVKRMVEQNPATTEVNLETAGISDEAMKDLGRLFRLQKLNLSHTRISGASLKEIADLPIQHLELTGVQVDRDAIGALNEIKTLTKLTITNNDLDDDMVAMLTDLDALFQVDFSSTKIGDRAVASLSRHAGIRKLILNDTMITDGCAGSLRKIPQLRLLSINETKISPGAIAAAWRSEYLTKLNMNRCPLKEADLPLLVKSFPRLEILSLGGTALSDKDLITLTDLSSLSVLKIPDCKRLTPKGIRAFRSEMPGCQVITAISIGDEIEL